MERHSYGSGQSCSQCGELAMVLYGQRRVCARCAGLVEKAEPRKEKAGTAAAAGEELVMAGEDPPDTGEDAPDAGEDAPDAGEDAPDAKEEDVPADDKKSPRKKGKR